MITEQNKRCVVSFANERGRYMENLLRLKQSLVGRFDGDFLGFVGEESIGSPIHLENPYAFKIYAIERALELGYSQILWLDTSCFAIRNLAPVFECISKDGYIAQEAGYYVGEWCNYFTLEYFGVTRDEAKQMPMYGNAGFLGLDFTNPIAVEFFQQWHDAMLAGCFKGSWEDHRHDMSAGSIIANKLGMKYKLGDEWLQYAAPETEPQNDTILIFAQG